MPLILSLILNARLLFAPAAHAEIATYIGKASWFTMTTNKLENATHVEFTNPGGELLSEEDISFSAPDHWQNYHWQQKQTGQEAKAELDGHSLKISYHKKDEPFKETIKTLSDKDVGEISVPPLLVDYALAHWGDLDKKGEISVLVVAPDRRDMFHFTFKKEKTSDPKKTSLVLKASSFMVNMVVTPIHFEFDENRKLLWIHGFKPPAKLKNKDGQLEGKLADVDFSGQSETKNKDQNKE